MKNISFLSKYFHYLVVKSSVYLNMRVFVMVSPVRCLFVVFDGSYLAFRSPRWGRRNWFLGFSLVCDMCTLCHDLFALPFGVLCMRLFLDIFCTIYTKHMLIFGRA